VVAVRNGGGHDGRPLALRASAGQRLGGAPATGAPTQPVTDNTGVTGETAPNGTGAKPQDRTAPERSRRYRARKKASENNVSVTLPPESATVRESVTVDARGRPSPAGTARGAPSLSRSDRAIDLLAYAAAIALAVAAAWFSIRGMIVLFPGSPASVVGMAGALESAKLVTAGWLAHRWSATIWIWRLVLIALVIGLAVINAVGVFAQLTAAHVGERSAATAAVETQQATLAARIEVQAKTVADLDVRIAQLDNAVAETTRRGRTAAALAAIESQRRSRAGLVEERKREAGALADLQIERAQATAAGRQVETETTPIRYVAAVFGIGDQETAIRWLILMMTLCCDPLAIALTAASAGATSPPRGFL
jgi:hypothetical protein